MLIRPLFYSFCLLFALGSSCQKSADGKQGKNTEPTRTPVVPAITEASGIADSRSHEDALWVISDSGNPPELVLLGYDGKTKAKLPVTGATNRDWEDLALAGDHLYIGDIGDNGQTRTEYQIYRVAEPARGATETAAAVTIRFRYPDGSHDAEAMLVDPFSKDIFIITKQDSASLIFRLPYQPYNNAIIVAEKVGSLSFRGVVSAALAPNGQQLLVKTYESLFGMKRAAGSTLAAALQTPHQAMPYEPELQGEAVCYKNDGSGYFTLPEQPLAMAPQYIRFYKQ